MSARLHRLLAHLECQAAVLPVSVEFCDEVNDEVFLVVVVFAVFFSRTPKSR